MSSSSNVIFNPNDLPDIPTGISVNESRLLSSQARGKVVLEIGALLGYSTVVMARTAAKVHSIDRHMGYPDHDPQPTAPIYFQNLHRYGVMDKIIAYVGDAIEILDGMYGVVPEFTFIDLNGHYDDTFSVLDDLLNYGSTGEGRIAIHDYGHPDWPGVKEAVDELVDKHMIPTKRLFETIIILDGR